MDIMPVRACVVMTSTKSFQRYTIIYILVAGGGTSPLTRHQCELTADTESVDKGNVPDGMGSLETHELIMLISGTDQLVYVVQKESFLVVSSFKHTAINVCIYIYIYTYIYIYNIYIYSYICTFQVNLGCCSKAGFAEMIMF